MHEMSIAQGILDIVLDAADKNDAVRVSSIRLLIGEMTEVEPESLRFCFNALAAGTCAEAAALDIVEVPLVGRCKQCSGEFRIERYRFICPLCQSPGVDIVSGRELRVEHLEVE